MFLMFCYSNEHIAATYPRHIKTLNRVTIVKLRTESRTEGIVYRNLKIVALFESPDF